MSHIQFAPRSVRPHQEPLVSETSNGFAAFQLTLLTNAWAGFAIALGVAAIIVAGWLENGVLASCVVSAVLLGLGTFVLKITRLEGLSSPVAPRLFLTAFMVRCLFMTILQVANLQNGSEATFMFDDEQFYANLATQHGAEFSSHHGISLVPQEEYLFLWTGALGAVDWLANRLGGPSIISLKLLNCFLSAFSLPFLYESARRLFSRPAALSTAFVALVMPELFLYSTTLLRDIAAFTLVAVACAECVKFSASRRLRHLVFAVSAVSALRYVRPEAAYVLGASLLLCGMLSSGRFAITRRLTVATLTILAALAFQSILRDEYAFILDPTRLAHRMDNNRTSAISAAAEGSLGARLHSLPQYIRVPAAWGQLFLELPPWGLMINQHFSLRGVLEFLGNTVWLFLLPYLTVGFSSALIRARETIWSWGVALAMSFALAYTTSIDVRWRLMVMPTLLVLVGHGIIEAKEYRTTLLLSRVGVLASIGLYVVAKGI